jgi:hypothetical protein
LKANVLFCRFFFESHSVLDQTQGTGVVLWKTLVRTRFWININFQNSTQNWILDSIYCAELEPEPWCIFLKITWIETNP